MLDRLSPSNWASPLHMIPKKSWSWFSCSDYCALIDIFQGDPCPFPYFHDVTSQIQRIYMFFKKWFSTCIQSNSSKILRHKAAITTPFGLFEFLRVSFRLRNAAQTFHRYMSFILHGLDFCFVYIDDVFFVSSWYEEQVEHVETIFKNLGMIVLS